MNRLRGAAGFTLIELVMVLAIIGVVSAFAVPSLNRYRIQEEAKEGAARVAGELRNARAQAMKQGIPHAVFFWPNGVPPAGTVIMRILTDNNGNFMRDAGELTRDVDVSDFGLRAGAVTGYNVAPLAPHPTAARAPGDPNATTLSTILPGAGGAVFPFDSPPPANAVHTVFTNVPAVGFTTRGIPVPVTNGASLGNGRGVFYVTDNEYSVYAVTVGGLGEIRVRTLVPDQNIWR